MQAAQAAAGTETAMSRALASLRARARMDMAFGAKVDSDGKAMTILQINGGLTRSLSGLTIANGAGLGGQALASGRPARVRDYLVARGITHLYDHAVEQERLRTVAALPVRVGNAVRCVVYLGNRSPLDLGDRWLDALGPLLGELGRELAVQDEVHRRLRQLDAPGRGESPGLSAAELREIASELAALAGEAVDEAVRSRLHALHRRIAQAPMIPAQQRPAVSLTARETAVLEQVASGCSNADAAERLGLLPNTVKSYLKSAMRKLGVNNRVQAIVAAREAGLIR